MTKSKVKWYQKTKIYRYLTQGIIFFFVLHLVLESAFASEDAITISAEAYCPLGGIATLYRFFSEGGKTLAHLHTSNVIILGLIVLITLLFRSGFCGWLCPFGTVQDLIRKAGKWIGKRSFIKPLNKKFHTFLRNHKRGLSLADKYARYIKYVILLWAVFGAFYYAALVFRDYDPFVALIKVTELESYTGVAILGFVLTLSLFMERPWCKYTCPLGATIGIIGKISPMRVKRDENLCTSCNLCTKSCPMNIDVANQSHVSSMDCNQCLECVDACPVKGAIDLKLVLPGQKQPTEIINTVRK